MGVSKLGVSCNVVLFLCVVTTYINMSALIVIFRLIVRVPLGRLTRII